MSTNVHRYIIVDVEYFIKWAKAMSTFNDMIVIVVHVFFNHVFTQLFVLKQLVFDHDAHFEGLVWHELDMHLIFEHQFSLLYYLHGNGQVEVVNKILKTMLQ
jgi:hypothetical protein